MDDAGTKDNIASMTFIGNRDEGQIFKMPEANQEFFIGTEYTKFRIIKGFKHYKTFTLSDGYYVVDLDNHDDVNVYLDSDYVNNDQIGNCQNRVV